MKNAAMIFSLIAIFFFISGFSFEPIPYRDDLTVYVQKHGVELAKYEPKQGAYLGAYVLQDNLVQQSMKAFNERTEKQHASFFKYVGYGKPFPREWVEQVKRAGAFPQIAWEPNDGLEEVRDGPYLRQFAEDAAKAGVPVFLRYASEMNGTWTSYDSNPRMYIEKWRLVHDVMEQEAPNVIMLWTVFTFPEETIPRFYPGDDYVDWVGINIYNVVYHNDSLEPQDLAIGEDPLRLLDYVYNTFSFRKPIQISEFGVSHYTSTDDRYYPEFAKDKLRRIYGQLPLRYPRVKSIYYFDVNNLINAPEHRKINDYSVTSDVSVLQVYKDSIADDYYLTKAENHQSETTDQVYSYNGFVFQAAGKSYAHIDFFTNYLDLEVVNRSDKDITLSDGEKQVAFAPKYRKVDRTFFKKTFAATGLPVRDVAAAFGYAVSFDKKQKMIWLHKK